MTKKLIESADALFAQYEEEAAHLEIEELIAFMKDRDFHAVETSEDTYALLTADWSVNALGKLYALVKLDEAITLHRASQEDRAQAIGA